MNFLSRTPLFRSPTNFYNYLAAACRAIAALAILSVGLTHIASAQSFAPTVDYPVGTNPYAIAMGDFSGDGKTDLAVANNAAKSISILLGNGDGTFSAKTDYPVGASPYAVTVADFNSDGKLDIATANSFSNTSNISVLFGNGNGTFATKTDYALVGFALPNSIVTGDFNGDGKPDLATANQGENNASVLLNTGNGTFGSPTNYSAGSFASSLTTSDFNNDNKLDLAVANYGGASGQISILLGKGDGTFNSASNYPAGPNPYAVMARDFNGDGKSDLITGSTQMSTISVLLGNGDGTFQSATNYVAASANGLAAGDFDGDGKLDLAVSSNGGYLVILLGNSNGTFQTPSTYEVSCYAVAAGDLNQDGKPDLVTASPGANLARVLLNKSGAYSITGIVTDQNNAALDGVVLELTGSTPVLTYTANNGVYSFRGLASSGPYTVTPSASHYTFSPTSQSFANLTENKTANFIGTLQSHILGGVVRDDNNVGLGGVTVTLSGTVSATTTTASDGSYLFPPVPGGGDYNIAPSLTNYNFSPSSRTFTDLSANNIANFTVLPITYRISGVVKNSNGFSGLSGMIVSLSGSASRVVTVSSDGAYSFPGLTPGGTYTVSVSAFKPGALFTRFKLNQPLTQTFSNLSGDATADFSGFLLNFSVGLSPNGVATGDFNGDGKRDLAVANVTGFQISVLLGNGDGTFQNKVNYDSGSNPEFIAVGDFNGDNKPDLAVANYSSFSVSILIGNGDGTFRAPVSYSAGTELLSVVTADFNSDGKLDLATTSTSTNGDDNVRVLMGNGDGTFQTATAYTSGKFLYDIRAGDFNGDSKPDLAFTNANGANILLNNGNGTFASAVSYAAGSGPDNLAIGDVNGDGKLDVIVANNGGNNVSVLLGTGSGTFGAAMNYAAGNNPRAVTVSDFNGDGKADLAVADYGNAVATLIGNGDGTFQSPVIDAIGNSPVSIAAGEFNGDGRPDLVATNNGGDSVSVLLNVITNTAPATISGRITTANGTPLSGVTLTLAGSQNATTQTDANGNYTLNNLAAGGTYTVTPAKTFYRFNPSGQTFNNLVSNQVGDFVATLLSFSIAGRVTDADGSPMNGVTVSLGGSQSATATTNSTGTYTFSNLAAGANYNTTPSLTGRTFTPPSRTHNGLSTHAVSDFRAAPAPPVQLSQGSYSIGEAGGSLQVAVSRADTTTAATVNYATSDGSGLNACSSVTGMASSRCDYATTIGTLRFAVGESTKTIYIPIIDDNIGDGNETFTLTLSKPSGASLGPTASATITITDNANAAGNPIDEASFFIREHYIDFLGREPEPQGLSAWLNIYNNCGVSINPPCDRIEISSAFFRSDEFQNRAYFVYRLYSAVGKIPLYEGFMPDFAKVSGFLSAQELEANKIAFVDEFITRQDYQSKYGSITDPTAYVNALLQTVGLPNHSGKATWITALTNQTMTRAQVFRALTESSEVYQKYYNEAFVIMQYFGYLRRSADISYLDWIQTMNSTGGDYRTMINGFLNSAEYRQRFGN